jgi:hypothetical protein
MDAGIFHGHSNAISYFRQREEFVIVSEQHPWGGVRVAEKRSRTAQLETLALDL